MSEARRLLRRLFDYVMVQEGGFKGGHTDLANEAAAFLGQPSPDTAETAVLVAAINRILEATKKTAGQHTPQTPCSPDCTCPLVTALGNATYVLADTSLAAKEMLTERERHRIALEDAEALAVDHAHGGVCGTCDDWAPRLAEITGAALEPQGVRVTK